MEFFTPVEIAERLGKSKRWVVDNLLATGEIPALHLGISWRVRPRDFEKWVDAKVLELREPELIPLPKGGRAKKNPLQGNLTLGPVIA
jgi:excisionase family DNA binding protein